MPQVQLLESEVADLEKELALRSEMEAALKDTLRELERKAARQDTGGRQVCLTGGLGVVAHGAGVAAQGSLGQHGMSRASVGACLA